MNYMTLEKVRETLYKYSKISPDALALLEYLNIAGMTNDQIRYPYAKLKKRFGWDDEHTDIVFCELAELIPVFSTDNSVFYMNSFDQWPDSVYRHCRYGKLYSYDDCF